MKPSQRSRVLLSLHSSARKSRSLSQTKDDNIMRKIEQNMIRAVVGMQSWQSDNTMVAITPDTKDEPFTPLRGEVFLHGHHIATMYYLTGALSVNKQTLARWPSSTTKSRLRALGVNVTTRKGVTYLDGVAV